MGRISWCAHLTRAWATWHVHGLGAHCAFGGCVAVVRGWRHGHITGKSRARVAIETRHARVRLLLRGHRRAREILGPSHWRRRTHMSGFGRHVASTIHVVSTPSAPNIVAERLVSTTEIDQSCSHKRHGSSADCDASNRTSRET